MFRLSDGTEYTRYGSEFIDRKLPYRPTCPCRNATATLALSLQRAWIKDNEPHRTALISYYSVRRVHPSGAPPPDLVTSSPVPRATS